MDIQGEEPTIVELIHIEQERSFEDVEDSSHSET
jgi:hypothetical protein